MINRLVTPTRRPGADRRRGHHRRARARAAPPHRLRHPGARPVPPPHRGREHRHRAAAAGLAEGPDRRPGRGAADRCSSSIRPSSRASSRTSSRAGSSSGSGVARALAAGPNILLMDEPFGALDAIIRGKAQEDLLAIQRRLRTTIVLVTHDMEEAFHLGDRIAVLDQGRLLQYRRARAVGDSTRPNEFVARLMRHRRPRLPAAVADHGRRGGRARARPNGDADPGTDVPARRAGRAGVVRCGGPAGRRRRRHVARPRHAGSGRRARPTAVSPVPAAAAAARRHSRCW